MSGEVPLTARVSAVEPPVVTNDGGHGGRIVLDYIAGDCPVVGQLVSLHHGPQPLDHDDYPCPTCGGHGVVPCLGCAGDGETPDPWHDDVPLIVCSECDGSGDGPCPDCGGGS